MLGGSNKHLQSVDGQTAAEIPTVGGKINRALRSALLSSVAFSVLPFAGGLGGMVLAPVPVAAAPVPSNCPIGSVVGADATIGSGESCNFSNLLIGFTTAPELSVESGGQLTVPVDLKVGTDSGEGSLVVTGASASATPSNVSAGTVYIGKQFSQGSSGEGQVTVSQGATLSASSGIALGNASRGTLTIGGPSGPSFKLPGTVTTDTIIWGSIGGVLTFEHNLIMSAHEVGSVLKTQANTAEATIYINNGYTSLTGDSSDFGGDTVIDPKSPFGGLFVDGTLGNEDSTVTVKSGGELGGVGTIGGDVTVDGTLAPGGKFGGLVGTLTINGNLALNSDSKTLFQLGQANQAGSALNDFIAVGENLELGGTLETSAGSEGFYYLMSYGGDLFGEFQTVTNVNLPQTEYQILTDTPGEVNLLLGIQKHETGFWDGTNMTANNMVDGGTGIWNDSNTNWTNVDGSENTAWGQAVGVFMGEAGTVTVDGSQVFETLQFKTDGYVLQGGELEFTNENDYLGVVNVDDGVNTTIASKLRGGEGTGDLKKVGGGRLTLTGGDNTQYGNIIEGGRLSVSKQENLGYGSLTFTGGTLETTDSFEFDNRVTLETDGYFDVAEGTKLTLATEIGGEGALVKQGAGTLFLTDPTYSMRPDHYAGGTVIEAGILQVEQDDVLGFVAGPAPRVPGPVDYLPTAVTLDGGTFQTLASFDSSRELKLASTGAVEVAADTTLGWNGDISGTGPLTKTGAGTMVLGGTGSYEGGTMVSAGRLVGNTTSIKGNIANAGTVEFAQADDGTFAGAIGGLNGTAGQMVKSGAGTLTLGGTSVLPWSVEAGGLISTTELFFGDLELADETSMTFDQAFDGSYAGTLTGSGDVFFTGGGLVTLTGDSSGYEGVSDVDDFTLHLDGDIGGTLNLAGAGRLTGNGTVGTTNVENGGSISPGNSIGTVTVAGNLTYNAGATYEVEVDPAGSAADLINVTGTATLNGGDVEHIGLNGTYAPIASYTILTAAGGVTGAFDSITSSYTFLDPFLDYTANTVLLRLERNDIDFATYANTPNQMAAATGLESLPDTDPVYLSILTLSDVQAPAAFDAVSGEIAASQKTGLIEDSRFLRQGALSQIAEIRDEALNVWVEPFGSWGTTNGNGNAGELRRDTEGVLMGADAALGTTMRAGILLGYQSSEYDLDARSSKTDADSYMVGVYGGTDLAGVILRGGAGYAWNKLDTTRTASYPGFSETLYGDTDANTTQAFVEAGYELGSGPASVQPFVGASYVNLHTDGFTETGGDAALNVAEDSMDTVFTSVGVRGSADFGMVTGSARMAWRHGFGDLTPTSWNAFAASTPFQVEGVAVARDVAQFGAGVSLDLGVIGLDGATVGVNYDGQFGDGATDNAVNGVLNVRF